MTSSKSRTWVGTGEVACGQRAVGSLSTGYSGLRPTDAGYNPMHKEEAIVLGIGGLLDFEAYLLDGERPCTRRGLAAPDGLTYEQVTAYIGILARCRLR